MAFRRCEISSKLTIKAPEWRRWRRCLLLTLNIFHTFFLVFLYCLLGNCPSLLNFLSFQITYELFNLLWLVSFNLFLLKQYYHNLSSYRRTNLDLCLDKIFLWKNFRRLSRHCLEEGKYDNSFTVIRNVNISPISCSTCYQGNIA